MAKFIIVHEHPKGQEILLNSDQIEYANVMELKSGTRTEVRMTNGNLHHLQESLDVLFGLCLQH
jgi:hypothetical protein